MIDLECPKCHKRNFEPTEDSWLVGEGKILFCISCEDFFSYDEVRSLITIPRKEYEKLVK